MWTNLYQNTVAATVRLEQTRRTNNIFFFAISPSTFVIASKPDRDKLMCIFFSSLRYGPKVQICEPTNERKNSRHALRRLINQPFYFRSKSPTGFTLMSMSPTKKRPTRISPGLGSVGSGSSQNTCSDTSGS